MLTEDEWTEPRAEEIEKLASHLIASPSGRVPTSFTGGHEIGGYWKWEPTDADLGDEKLVFLAQYWRSLSSDGTTPDVEAIDPLDIKPALGNVLLLDVIEEGYDCRYRVYGTNVVAHAGRDWTGATVSEMNRTVKSPLALFYRGGYRAAFRAGAPIFTQHNSLEWQSPSSWLRLILPLADQSGKIKRFIVGNVPADIRFLSSDQRERQARRIRGAGE